LAGIRELPTFGGSANIDPFILAKNIVEFKKVYVLKNIVRF
jgi:hypothetical protein